MDRYTPLIKICGITRPEETGMINRAKVDFAGFVIYEPSKRYVNIDKACRLAEMLDPAIRKVAVVVSPGPDDIRNIEEAGFADYIQIHGHPDIEALEAAVQPVWIAVNLSDIGGLTDCCELIDSIPADIASRIDSVVADAPGFGSGHTFDWNPDISSDSRIRDLIRGRRFILAGGLNPGNVSEGIRIFHPDIVDVSSGVEGDSGKDEAKIREFVQAVRIKM